MVKERSPDRTRAYIAQQNKMFVSEQKIERKKNLSKLKSLFVFIFPNFIFFLLLLYFFFFYFYCFIFCCWDERRKVVILSSFVFCNTKNDTKYYLKWKMKKPLLQNKKKYHQRMEKLLVYVFGKYVFIFICFPVIRLF